MFRSVGLKKRLSLGNIEGRTFSEDRELVKRWEEIKYKEEVGAHCYAINKRDMWTMWTMCGL